MTWLVPAACILLVAAIAFCGGVAAAARLYCRGARDADARRDPG